MPEALSSRRPVVVGNWKMHKTPAEGIALARVIREDLFGHDAASDGAEVVLAPAFVALTAVSQVLVGSGIRLAAQDVFFATEGAYTGAVSARMLRAAGCSLVFVGHSERRQVFAETNEDIQRKTDRALAEALDPIVCVGETLLQRDRGDAERVVHEQCSVALAGVEVANRHRVAVAYEPVWAIGSGRTATPAIAQAMHRSIRDRLTALWGARAADAVRILYGGSVTGDNAAAIMAAPDVDGVLIGGASLTADSFLAIVHAVA